MIQFKIKSPIGFEDDNFTTICAAIGKLNLQLKLNFIDDNDNHLVALVSTLEHHCGFNLKTIFPQKLSRFGDFPKKIFSTNIFIYLSINRNI